MTALDKIRIDVLGKPITQGSMVPRTVKGKTYVVPDNDADLKTWRGAIAKAARARREILGADTFDGPLDVTLTFFLARPPSVPVAARPLPHLKPDVDKLVRACFDALTYAEVWADDARAVTLLTRKRYAHQVEGVRIDIRRAEYGMIATRDEVDRLADLAGEALAESGLVLTAGPGRNVAAIRLVVSTLLDEIEEVIRA